jgi:hypothetical protein
LSQRVSGRFRVVRKIEREKEKKRARERERLDSSGSN